MFGSRSGRVDGDAAADAALEQAALMNSLVKKRNGCKGLVSKIQGTIGKHDTVPLDSDDVDIMLNDLSEIHDQYKSIQLNIFELCDDDETEVQVGVFELMYDKVRECRKALLKIQRALGSPDEILQSTVAVPTAPAQPWTPKLPSIQLQSFDGRYEMWNNFEAIFSATVDKHPKLEDAQKLHYLVTSMKGPAFDLIKAYDIIPSNYTVVWDVLKKRYSNEREKIQSILDRLFKQPVVRKESVTELQKLADTTNECVLSLKNLKVPVEHWDCVLVYLVQDRLDRDSHREWCRRLKATEYPTYKEICEFLDDHIRGLRSVNPSSQQMTSTAGSSGNRNQASSFHGLSDKCWHCSNSHAAGKCRKLKSLAGAARYEAVRAKAACFICLELGHGSRSCTSKELCGTNGCKGKHHSFLHRDKTTTTVTPPPHSGPQQQATTLHARAAGDTQVLLSTVLVKVKDQQGTEVVCRGLLDGGSGATLITENCVKRLGLKRQRDNLPLRGVGGIKVGSARGRVKLFLNSCVGNGTVEVDAYILPRVTGTLPALPCNTSSWSHVKGLRLADPNCHEPGPVDILLDADVTSKVELDGKIDGCDFTPRARNTIFGWVLSGRVEAAAQFEVPVHTVNCEVDDTLRRFWELEELPPMKHLTKEEETVENHFVKTHTRDEEGRYVVELPFRVESPNFIGSRSRAVTRLKQVEKRLSKLPERREQYVDFMREYQLLGHMKPIPTSEADKENRYYLPHHFVQKLESTTTALRVVFDGSAKDCEGKSLNNLLYVGPTIQDDLFTILLRFRTHIVALKADIGKMYRQFRVKEDHANFQCIVWRESPELPIQDYKLPTLTYGTASAAFLATRCLRQLSFDEEKDFPSASKVLRTDLYVDDLLGGESTPERAKQLQQQLCELVKRGGMEMRKWTSSDPKVLASIPVELREKQELLSLDTDCTVKALGVQWNPSTDKFMFSVVVPETTIVTKRVLLSELAKVFDPLGWLSPTTICAKIMFQDLWKLDFDWDQPLPANIQQKWQDYRNDLHHIRNLSIPRCVISSGNVLNQFHGFSDASEKAYAAVVYLRCQREDGSVSVRLLAAKTKVAPIRQVSLPRLELCGAVLLGHLMSNIKIATNISGEEYAWSDSTTALHWIKSHPGRWKTFVANRVAEVQGLIPGDRWSHVKGEDNPADCPSRGIPASELVSHSLWWDGPSWLKSSSFPVWSNSPDLKTVKSEEKKQIAESHHMCIDESLISKYSDLNRLKRTTARCLRFIDNCRSKTNSTAIRSGPLSVAELQNALHHHIRYVQETEFIVEFKSLRKSKSVPASSKLLQLSPFMDKTGLLRVGGRLQKSNLPEELKHQIILPNNHHLTRLIINHHHHLNMHAGFQLLWATMQREYWILRSRDTIRHEIRKCVTCRRQRAETAKQLMGSLPSPRVNPGRPFEHCGVDYAGPYSLRIIKGRGNGKSFKCYFAIFVCFAVKAIHLEAVTDLTSEAFIAAFRRFSARRGVSSHLYSDCGTNFVGADKELKELLESSVFNSDVSHFLADRGTTWHFNSPSAPHHGGLWEAGVSSVKFHLKRVVGNASLTLEEFQTVLCQAEACLNSRPLCSLSTDPNDYDVLTPGHFLIGQPLTAIPEPDLTSLPVNRLSRWQHMQQITQHFWKRWSSEYVSSLQQRFKWTEKRDDLKVGDLVIVKDDDLPPMKWKMGRITDVHPGTDNLVRIVTVKTASGEYERPVVKLCPLMPVE